MSGSAVLTCTVAVVAEFCLSSGRRDVKVEIGGVMASLEDIAEAVAVLSSYKDSTAVKQLLEPKNNVLANCGYRQIAAAYLHEHPDRVAAAGSKEKHIAHVKNAFVEYLAEQLATNGINIEVTESGAEQLADDGGLHFEEGALRVLSHRVRERSRALMEKKKAAALKCQGALICEVCDFDFHGFYGDMGQGFIEAHHIVPLCKAGHGLTQLADLALVCSNCHRMLHRALLFGTKELSPAELRIRLGLMHPSPVHVA